MERYGRQMLLGVVGEVGQRRLGCSHALVAGCGALGCVVADALARGGVGKLTVIDRDVVEITNLQRQILFTERDAEEGMPKAEAARRRLRAVNSDIVIEGVIDDINPGSIERYVDEGVDVIVDGLDNFETRYLLNDVSVRYGVPYVYGGAVGTNGMTASFLPHRPEGVEWKARRNGLDRWDGGREGTPCLRCVFPEAPPAGVSATCDTAGVLGAIVMMIGAMEAAEAIKIMIGDYQSVNRDLVMIDVWRNEMRRMKIGGARGEEGEGGCVCCGEGKFEYLEGERSGSATSLCGRDSVQIVPGEAVVESFDFEAVVGRITEMMGGERNEFMLRFCVREGGREFAIRLFPNGRAVISGTDDAAVAKGLYARYVGN